MLLLLLFASAVLSKGVVAQQGLIYSQNDTFNSSFSLTAAQKTAANLSDVEAHNVEVAINFERSNYAGPTSVTQDPFYTLPETYDSHNPPPPGAIIKLESYTDTSLYTLPPSLSMSRFLYMSETLNGSSVPASAYILWPYEPRRFAKVKSSSGNSSAVFPVVGLAHGTSGQTPQCAPSHIRNLWDEFHEPFPLALAGYAVVAPDYAGLGLSGVACPYFVLPAQANDLFHAVAAAQSAFPDALSEEFVIMGQSHGAGTAWSAAQRQAKRPVRGYLGTVAVSPFTNILANIAADPQIENNVRVVGIAQGLGSVLSSFQLSDWLTDAGIARLALLQEIGGCSLAAGYLYATETLILKDGWNETSAALWYANVSDNGEKPFAGPLLVLQGDEDANANVHVTASAVAQTCNMFPKNSLHYLQYTGISHVPVLFAGQHVWFSWLHDRFSGVKEKSGCIQEIKTPTRGVSNGAGQKWIVEYSLYI